MENVPSKYDKEKQIVSFDVTHFSHYVAEQIEEAEEEIKEVPIRLHPSRSSIQQRTRPSQTR